MKRAVIYCRVSTKEQADSNISLPTQEKNGYTYAKKHNLNVIREPIQDVYSGEELNRPGMNQLRRMMRNAEIDAVIALDADRISRDDFDYHLFREECVKYEIELHYTPEGLIKLGELGTDIHEGIKGRLNREENKKRAFKSKLGRQERSETGFIMTSRPAYGYRVKKRVEMLPNGRVKILERCLLPDEEEAPVVREIFELYVYQEMSIFAIVDYLNEKGYQTPGDKGRFKKQRERGIWSNTTVGQILKNTIYKGEFTYSGISVDVPAIVSADLWQQAQIKRKKSALYRSRRRKHDYLLSSRVFCQTCGSPMSGGTYPSGKETTVSYYRCNRRIKKEKIGECGVSMHFRTDKVHDVVITWIVETLQNEEKLERGLRAYQEEQAAQYAPLTEELKSTKDVVDKAKRKLSRFLEAFLDEEMEEELFADKKKELKQHIEKGTRRIAEIEEKLNAVLLTPERIKTIKHLAADVKDGAELLPDDKDAQKELIIALDVHVFLSPAENKMMKIKAVGAIGKLDESLVTINYSSSPSWA